MTLAADIPAARVLSNRHEAVPASTATQIWPNVKDQVAKAREEAGEVQWDLGRHSELRRQGSVTKASHIPGLASCHLTKPAWPTDRHNLMRGQHNY
jgi:hypothetical protein